MNDGIITCLRRIQELYLFDDALENATIEAAIAALTMPNCWQPFADAPRDGSEFLLGITARCNPETHHIEEQLPNGSWKRVTGDPTHWHPLLDGEHRA